MENPLSYRDASILGRSVFRSLWFLVCRREQNTLEEGAQQLNKAFDEYGVNFLDTYVAFVDCRM